MSSSVLAGADAPASVVHLSCGRSVGGVHPCLVVAEIGQNHQGDLQTAKKLIQAAQRCGADVVKFQKTSLSDKFCSSALSRRYDSPHSWGATYGEHKNKLELTECQHRELQRYASELGVIYTASAMDPVSAQFLISLDVPFIKIGSGDADNLPMIDTLAQTSIPLFISTGMQSEEAVQRVYRTVTRYNCPLALLQCTSAYPTPASDIHLAVLPRYRRLFPRAVIGYSGHEQGSTVSLAAVALGAKIIERHLTLDRTWKGSDHGSSLEPEQLAALVREVRLLERAIGSPLKAFQPSETACWRKLSKSVVASHHLRAGHTIGLQDLAVKVCDPKGWPPGSIHQLEGRRLAVDVDQDDGISGEMLTACHQPHISVIDERDG